MTNINKPEIVVLDAIMGSGKTLGDRKINLYTPSKRMRNLLENWLEDKFEGVG